MGHAGRVKSRVTSSCVLTETRAGAFVAGVNGSRPGPGERRLRVELGLPRVEGVRRDRRAQRPDLCQAPLFGLLGRLFRRGRVDDRRLALCCLCYPQRWLRRLQHHRAPRCAHSAATVHPDCVQLLHPNAGASAATGETSGQKRLTLKPTCPTDIGQDVLPTPHA